jgi:alkanesulfonate monooxygenase SsuD/methylene tetrahydromethanopterin reductase-like flavin-dependent oxidoreductase (luciferase family)
MATGRGFGIAGALDHAIVKKLAAEAERAGFASFWANDTPGGDGLAALAAAAHETTRIKLGVGVIPVDRTPAATIAKRLHELDLPQDRIIVGLGSGGLRSGAVAAVEEAATALIQRSGVRVYVGALGPRMCELGGRRADGLLLNWLTPGAAREAAALARAAAARANRAHPAIAAYVRVALPEGASRLRAEADRYAGFPQYAAHFSRIGTDAFATTVHGARADIQRGLEAFDGIVDEVVARAITPDDSVSAYLDLLRSSAPDIGGRSDAA